MSISKGPPAYLVIRRDSGYGDVFPLTAGRRHTMGRANTNPIVLKDDLCSREHAEAFQDDGRWFLRDLHSLNGTRINGENLEKERELRPNDEVNVGRSFLIFVQDLGDLPSLPDETRANDGTVSIKKRLRQTR